MGVINVCTEFEMFEIKVPIIFLGTAGFSPFRCEILKVIDCLLTYEHLRRLYTWRAWRMPMRQVLPHASKALPELSRNIT
jgi:hypothetical protein